MLIGRYGDTSGRPYVEGRLVIPRLGIRTNISFCVDTGADVTVLMPIDSLRLNVSFAELANESRGVGVGGEMRIFEEPAALAFADPPHTIYVYEIGLKIIADSPRIRDLPSLLGRDILHQWHMDYRPSEKTLKFDVVAADRTLPMHPGP